LDGGTGRLAHYRGAATVHPMLIITHEDDRIINSNAEKISLFGSLALPAFAEKG
jgi:hypothetical protein